MAIYQCPVALYDGEVELDEYLNYRQLASYERGMIAAQKILQTNPDSGFAEIRLVVIPGIISCVKVWRLKGLPEKMTIEDFPSTPKKEAGDLYLWLLELVKKKIEGEDASPN